MDRAKPFSSIAVIGAGAWGTALAHLCAENGIETLLWAREQAVADGVNQHHENKAFLPGIALTPNLRATTDVSAAAKRAAFLFAVPAQHSRAILEVVKKDARPSSPLALCCKGVERKTGLLMTEVLDEIWPAARPAVLSGPSFARDVAEGLPTAVTLACADADLGQRWIATVGARHFRPYLSDDLIGVELGGAVKNVLAIAAGAVVGRGLGDSARAAVIARGFAEFQRLGVAMGAKPQTMAGLSGLGDLILTATSRQSRNMSLGCALGEGRALEEVLAERNDVCEGVASAGAVAALAEKAGVEAPICAAVAAFVNGEKSIDDIIDELLARPFKAEGK
jgi:glycerol-3-phosphate dehydrogenase (NAD(P)+)